ncbi:hypothetical protein F8M41_025952 [Gigaspora margarita]|uniref:Uncharacterized protein n=1 Tax=Gigaspora margarita TaxID=4874 RepID=A0A8H4AZU8_GIGMA|nr:hypothetical protein F8M41_025952 [Gigaspora margarita]
MNKKISDDVIRNISGIEVDIDSVKVVQEFYVKCELTSDMVLEEPEIDENIIDEEYVMKEYSGRRKVLPVKSVNQDDTSEFDVNSSEATNVENFKERFQVGNCYQHEIGNEKDKQKEFVYHQNNNYRNCSDEAYDLGSDYKNKSIELNNELLEQRNLI